MTQSKGGDGGREDCVEDGCVSIVGEGGGVGDGSCNRECDGEGEGDGDGDGKGVSWTVPSDSEESYNRNGWSKYGGSSIEL